MSKQQPTGWSARTSVRAACWAVCVAVYLGDVNHASAGPFTDWLKGFHQPSTPTGNCAGGKCAPGAVPGAVPGAAPGTIVYPPGVSPPPPPGGTVIPGSTLPGTTLQPGAMPPSTIPSGGAFPGGGYPTRTNYPPTYGMSPAYGAPPAVSVPRTAPPTTTYYNNMQPGAQPVGQPVAQPPAGYYTPAAAAPSCPSCQRPVTVNYAPYTAYRTTWIQVPVTVYRPVSGIDPATGRPVTIVQPCQTTQWQVQRVPVSGPFTSMYRALPVSGYQTVAPAHYPGAPCVVAPAAAVAPGTTFATPAAPGISYPAGTYPNGTYPGGAYPSGAVPSVTAPARPATPSFPGNSGTTIPGGGLTPADRAPSLNPGGVNYPPATDPYSSGTTLGTPSDSTIPHSASPPPPPPPTESSAAGAGATGAGATGAGATGAGATGRGNAGQNTNRSTSGESRPLKVRPIPDPDYSKASPLDQSGRTGAAAGGVQSAPSNSTVPAPSSPRSASPSPAVPSPAVPSPAAPSPAPPSPVRSIPGNPSIDSPLRNVPPLLSPRDRTADRGEYRWRSLNDVGQ